MVDHAVALRGLSFDPASGRPLVAPGPAIYERIDEDFIAALLRELGDDLGRKGLAAQVVGGEGLRLFQPVHRTFYVVLLAASCEVHGEPRLDPRKIASAGLVVRRLRPEGAAREVWLRRDGEPRGWQLLVGAAEARDPDPARRTGPRISGDPELDRQLFADDGLAEATSPLFVAPPALCAALGQTILYGLVPVTSSERALRPEAPSYEPDEVRARLGDHLAAEASESVRRSLADGKRYTAAQAASEDPPPALRNLLTLLRGLVSVFDAFNDAGLMKALDAVSLGGRPGGQTLRRAAEVLLFGGAGDFEMPAAWPRLTKAQAAAIEREAGRAAKKRLAQLLGRAGRFDEPEARYELRAFVRVKRSDGCPPKLFWSAGSTAFTIASWFDAGKVPPTPIRLPRITPETVKKMLPNVAFEVPAELFALLGKNKAKDFLSGDASAKDSDGIDWICGFNIPIITLCAFIVLSIFLSLLNIVFWWLAFIKICIPLPRSLTRAKGGAPA